MFTLSVNRYLRNKDTILFFFYLLVSTFRVAATGWCCKPFFSQGVSSASSMMSNILNKTPSIDECQL